MTQPSYSDTSPSSIESFGRRLVGSTVRKTKGLKDIPSEYSGESEGAHTKGTFGKLVESFYYGIDPGNQACSPDFKDAGVELKTHSLTRGRSGFSAKERLSLGDIQYNEIVSETFETSCFMRKNRLLMLISRRHTENDLLVDAKIELANLIDFNRLPKSDQQIIKEDWNLIAHKVRNGQAHLLSGSDTRYLEAATKGRDGSVRVSQPHSEEPARRRAFAFKAGYLTSLVRRYLNPDAQHTEVDQQEIISDPTEIGDRGFEKAVMERFHPFLDLTIDEIEDRLTVSPNREAKGYRATLVRLIMGVSAKKVAEFERAGIELKTILIHENGLSREHMSFPAFRYMGNRSILTEDWDAIDSDEEDEDGTGDNRAIPLIKRTLEDRRFLFAVFEKDSGRERLAKVVFWSMPVVDIERHVRPVWKLAQDCIRSGNLAELPGVRFNHVCHVRTHGRGSGLDTLPTPHNGQQTRRSFWLDKHYIQAQIATTQ